MRALVTGGAGFIGSHIAEALLAAGHETRVLDDLSSGYAEHVPAGAEFILGDVADARIVREAVRGVDLVFHQAAHRAVLRSVQDPLATDRANTHGTLTVLKSAVDAGVKRVVYASSSSVYGGAEISPTPESTPVHPRSPYAVSKLSAEMYCRLFAELYGMETVSLRYFNVFGPRQRPDSAYAAVIPLFIEALRRGEPPTVHGDGTQSRDFTYIEDVVGANVAAAGAPSDAAQGQVYNVANGVTYSLLDMLRVLEEVIGVEAKPVFTDPRPGDIYRSCGDGTSARQRLGWKPTVSFDEGLRRTVAWLSGAGVDAPADLTNAAE